MKFKTLEVAGIYPAILGMRYPKKSTKLSDTEITCCPDVWSCSDCPINGKNCDALIDSCESTQPLIGEKDMKLAHTLIKAGAGHRKFLRQIQVWVSIQAPVKWWKQCDTLRAGFEKNSESTMHTLMSKPIEAGDFSNIPARESFVYNITKENLELQIVFFWRGLDSDTSKKHQWKKKIIFSKS